MGEAKKILIIQTAFVGDLLLGIPLLRRLRSREPSAHITLYCRKGLGEYFLKSELVDEIVEVDKSSRASQSESANELRAQSWDWVICPHESFRSQMLVGSLKAKRKTGYKKWWNFRVFNERIIRPLGLPESLRQLALITANDPIVRDGLSKFSPHPDFRSFPELASLDSRELGVVPEWAEMGVPRLANLHSARGSSDVLKKVSTKVRELAETHKLVSNRGSGIVVLAPGSVWATKMWTEDGYLDSARELLKMGFRVVITGAKNEKDLAARIAQAAPGVIDLTGQTSLYESNELLALADLLICNDSGAMHMAAAAGLPSVAVFGPTTLALGYRPWQNQARIVQRNMSCRPCGTHGAKRCPLGHHNCMKSITAGDVLHEAGELLKRSSART